MDSEKFSVAEVDCNPRAGAAFGRTEERTSAAADSARHEIVAGLTAPQAFVSSQYFYDARGSRLFEMITALPEYYLTRTERTIFAEHALEISAAVGTGVTLIDLGAGNCGKAQNLFRSLKPAQYVAIDISIDFLRQALKHLQMAYPEIEMLAVGANVYPAPDLPNGVRRQHRLFFYPGSSIGNFTPEEAHLFLTGIRAQCGEDGGLLIGVDLVKSEAILIPAYDDVSGVTAAFNFNLLQHLNRIIGSNFSARDWQHRAFFNAALARIEMHLEARRLVCVAWPGGGRQFAGGESIHTENSYKYALHDFENMLMQAGFKRTRSWTDEKQWFAVCHATV